jgi:EAL domain-containing protein (putative c-di-GMP-specific phosphodiesterase class I)
VGLFAERIEPASPAPTEGLRFEVLVRTVAHLAAHPGLHAATRLCSISVAGPTLCDPAFPDFVKRALSTHRVDPQRLADRGLSIALDDFGTGRATFDYLKRRHADLLKIDGALAARALMPPGPPAEVQRMKRFT